MKESIFYAGEEMKRAEHLLYVSLKYTRTCDVMKSLIERLISCFDHVIEGILRKNEEENLLSEVPSSPFAKAECLRNLYSKDRKLTEFIEFYYILRKIMRGNGVGSHEFRRNVRMIAKVETKEVELTIDILEDYYQKTEEFLRYGIDLLK